MDIIIRMQFILHLLLFFLILRNRDELVIMDKNNCIKVRIFLVS